MTRHRQVRLVCSDPKVDVTVNMGAGPATPTAGMSKFEVVDRENGEGMTTPIGGEPYAQDVPIFLDGLPENRSVDRTLEQILSLGEERGIFRAFGPIWREGDRFVFGSNPDFDELLKANDGRVLRARFTLHLMKYVPANAAGETPKGKRGHVGKAVALTYTVGAGGETLAKIAFKIFDGDWKRWPDIGPKNGIRDPFRVLPPGRVLNL
jgi:hypothetical protein